ncbi:MAG: hypothetical protein IJ260_10105, partial [Butyrivibrio sp.]|nr:hypothetical protein [Butyrivibrio sp.]
MTLSVVTGCAGQTAAEPAEATEEVQEAATEEAQEATEPATEAKESALADGEYSDKFTTDGSMFHVN